MKEILSVGGRYLIELLLGKPHLYSDSVCARHWVVLMTQTRISRRKVNLAYDKSLWLHQDDMREARLHERCQCPADSTETDQNKK